MMSIDTRSDNSLGDIFLYITILYCLHDFFIKTRGAAGLWKWHHTAARALARLLDSSEFFRANFPKATEGSS